MSCHPRRSSSRIVHSRKGLAENSCQNVFHKLVIVRDLRLDRITLLGEISLREHIAKGEIKTEKLSKRVLLYRVDQ